ncbi:hypothetical protein ACFWZ2_02160 [Streptomyces sp. NPDC059002]|uniref:hypothetical protein n=1 Tax=Streptomyces sp. NPDC059002 TaxID=3346690 RepID=UPI0036A9B475
MTRAPLPARRAPVDLPAPHGDNNIEREPLWYAFAAGDDQPPVPPWTWTVEPPMTEHTHPPAPDAVRRGARTPLPFGTTELLTAARYPDGRPVRQQLADTSAEFDPLGHALVAALGAQWVDPDNAYNPHRGYASPRCLYPVQAFLERDGRRQLVSPQTHALVDLDPPSTPREGRRIILTGRYTRIPRGYKWFRGSLVSIELGFVLRSLAIALELFGIEARLRLPDAGSPALLAELGLGETAQWSLPLVIDLDTDVRRDAPPAAPPPGTGGPARADASLTDLVRLNRSQLFPDPPARLGTGIAPGARPSARTPSWADLMWQRNSGRMPRGLLGMNGRLRRTPADALRDAVDWLSVPPPGATARAAFDAVRVTAVVQAVDGHDDGIYRIRAGRAELHRRDPSVAASLEREYGYPLGPDAGCDIRHASGLWFLTARPRQVVDRFGPAGWSALQYACGWALHGLSLSAAAFGMFARPVRAFNEIPVQGLLDLEEDEMITLAAVVGTPRHATGALLDIRL